jgi:hypothetical protein
MQAAAANTITRPWWKGPVIISEKNTPMDSAVPEFWRVERMPEATPRCPGGTLLMIAEVLGAENIPCPMPLSRVAPMACG